MKMNRITHQQASEYIHIGLPGLEETQQRSLAAHLGECAACQDYANLQQRLSAELSRAMHNRWDGQLSSVTKPHKITSGVRRNTMLRNAFAFTYISVWLGVLILGLFAVFNWVVIPALVPSPSSRSTETSPANLPLQLDPSVCNEKAYPAPSGVKLPYLATKVIGGGIVQRDNLTFQIYLYCDDTLRPDDPQHFSEIAGLGIAASWHYSGPDQPGQFQYRFGIEPAVALKTELTGLKKGDEGGYSGGFSFPDHSSPAWQVPELAKSGRPIQFSIQVGSGEVMDGASLSFSLQEGVGGYLPVDIVTTLKPETTALPVTTPGPVRENCAARTQTILYTVQSGDTILGIADNYCLKPETIYWANYDLLQLNENSLVVGLDIKIPAKDADVTPQEFLPVP